MQRKIQTFFNTCLRRIYKIQWQEKIRNEDLRERAGQEPVAKQILRRKWGWIGHTLRKPASSTTRQALTWNPQGKRKRDWPRNSWRRDTEAELKKQGTNWSGMTRAAQNRVRWRGVCLFVLFCVPQLYLWGSPLLGEIFAYVTVF